jgi:hypothetical protein
MHLMLRKCTYSVNPWRLGQVQDDGTLRQIPHAHFPRRRTAQPWFQRFLAAADWSLPLADWPPDMRARVEALVEELPGYQEYAALVTRERAQVARGGW